MERITTQLTSPEWWFTVVIVGLLVSVLGAYARDWIGRLLSSFSYRMAAWIRSRRVQRRLKVRFLSRNIDLLQIEYSRSLVILLVTISAFALSFVLPGWDTLVHFYPQADFIVSAIGVPQLPRNVRLIFYGALLLQGMALWNKFLSRYSTCERARRLHIRRRRYNNSFKPTPRRGAA